MEAIRDDTIGGFNVYLDGLKGNGEAEIDFTLVQFDSIAIASACAGRTLETALAEPVSA